MIDLLCLIEFYNTYEHDDIYHEISKKMLRDFHTIGHMGMQELADYLFVSTSTLYRFVKMMWYENYGQMKTSQQMFLDQYMHSGRYMPNGNGNPCGIKEYGEYMGQWIKSITCRLMKK